MASESKINPPDIGRYIFSTLGIETAEIKGPLVTVIDDEGVTIVTDPEKAWKDIPSKKEGKTDGK